MQDLDFASFFSVLVKHSTVCICVVIGSFVSVSFSVVSITLSVVLFVL